jgi:regulator of replication initiation timing
MSQNRAVQAAQRRRAGGPEPAAPGRGPQPSINSSQLFSQGQQQGQQSQMRPGTNGRLAGQQAQLQQQQMQQQMKQQMSEPRDQGLASVNRMTLAQAITLITLRLGKVETHLQEHDNSQMSGSGLDSGIIDVIMSRLDALESQGLSQSQSQSPVTNSNANANSSLEVTALKQNVDVLKTAISQSKSSYTSLLNEHKTLKQEVESLKSELASLQGLTMENSQQLMKLSLAVDLDSDAALNLEDGGLEELSNDDNDNDNTLDNNDNEIVGTDLKDLIEKELKL